MNQQSYVHIRLRRDTAQNWTNNNPILKIGEPGLETDTRKLKFGDGTTAWNNLQYSGVDVNDNLLLENIDDRVANLIKAGSNISVSYNDSSNELIISATGLQLSGDYATLVNGKIPAIQLPSYVDDVLEFNNLASFPSSGEGDKIYVTKDSNKTYRWSGSSYIEISASPGSTDAVPEGSINKYYTDARASAAAPVQSVAGRTGVVTLTKSDVGLGNVDNTSDANKPVSTAQASADTAVQNAASTDATTKANNAQAFAIQRSNHTGTQAISTISGLQSALDGKSATSHTHDDRYYTESEVDNLLATKQSSGTYATLVNGTVPASQLPSYVDDVIEAANFSALPATGESGKIYVTLDSNKTYRWSGSVYIEISASPGSTDAVPEGSVNKYYTDARASAAAPVQSVSGKTGTVTLTKSDVGLGNVDNTSDANKPVSIAQQTALDLKAPIANPTFTGTVNGITKGMVGLGNVDNTGDANKPISVATQSALDLKAPLNCSILSLGSLSGSNAIDFRLDRLLQTITLAGSAVTFTKGSGWPVTNITADIILRITVTSATTITWTIVNDWFNQPVPGALSVGTHIFLLRAIGSSIIEGHYIGNKTN